ncbi:MAG: gliding motility-associated C-terminal domain-containing protein, partial [Chitinophagales bacterium]
FLGNDVELCEGETLTLNAPLGATYLWQDSSTADFFEVTEAGTYSVTVTANGCSSSDEIEVTYSALPTLDLGEDMELCEGESIVLAAPLADSYLWQNNATSQTIEASASGTFGVTITSGICTSSGDIEVTVNPFPTIDLGEDLTLCEGESTVLMASTADSYEWSSGATTQTIAVNQAGVYDVTITSNDCSSSDQIEVFYNPLPVISLGEDLTLCEGENTTLDATPDNAADLGTITYLWHDNSTNPTFAVSEGGTFAVTVTSNGCQSIDEVVINFDTLPSINLGEDQTLCEGETLVLDGTLEGATYEWQDASTDPTFEVVEAGEYAVTVTLNTCVLIGNISIDYNPLPTIDLGEDQSICGGESIILDATTANATYEWQDATTGATFEVTTSGLYEVAVTVDGCTSIDEVNITLAELPSFDLGNDLSLCEGQTTTLDATPDNAASFNSVSYEWQDASTNPTFEAIETGTYAVTVTADGCTSIDEILVTIEAGGTIDLGEDLALCEGETFTLDVTTPDATYEWQDASTNPTFEVTTAGTYEVTVTVDGCSLMGSIEVTYSPQPAIDLGIDQSICGNESITLDATTANATYLWQDDSTNPTFEASNSGTYAVTVSVNNCSVSDEIELTINPIPTIELGAAITICEGENTTLSAPLSDAYLWSNNAVGQDIQVTQSGTYTVTITNNGCSNSDAVEVIVNALPVVELGADVTLCQGETTTLDVTTANATYLWQDNSTNPTFEVSTAGTYAVTVTANGCSSSDEIAINFDNAGTIDLGENVTLCEGETLTLDATTANATYEWQDASTNPTFEVTAAGTYSVTVTIAGGCLLLGEIEVDYAPQPVADLGNDLNFCEGETTTLDAAFAGATYQWQDGSTNPTFEVSASGNYAVTVSVGNCSATDELAAVVDAPPVFDLGTDITICEGETATLIASNATTYIWSNDATDASIDVTQAGVYTVTATNNNCSSTDEIEVFVNPNPVVNLGADVTLCQGETTTLDATTANATYLWQDNSTNPTFDVSLAGTYAVTVTTNNCSSADEITINFDNAGTIDLGENVTLCEGESLTLDATTANATYEWQDASTDPTFEVTAAGTYSVTVTIAGGCLLLGEIEVDYAPQPAADLGADLELCEGETTTLDATFAGATYQWQDGSTNPTFDVSASGNYAVTVSVGNCSATDELAANVSAIPSADLGPDISICAESVPLIAPIADNYAWSTGGVDREISVNTSGTYTVTVTNGNCSDSDEILVDFGSSPSIDLGGTIVLCGGLGVTLDVTQTAANATYEWQDGTTNPIYELTQSGNYAVTVTVGDCSVSDMVEVSLQENATVDLGMDTVLCAGQSLQLAASLGDAYLWQDGSTSSTFDVTEVGTYTVTVTVDECDLTGSINVSEAVLPSVDLGADISICEGESVTLEGILTDAFSFLWLENGAVTPTLDVTESGTYTLQVFSENSACAVASDDVQVTVEICEEPEGLRLAIPNAFSPNGDGFNDVFGVSTNVDFLSMEMKLYNRWGKMLFSSTDVNATWDGFVGDEVQPVGVYVYYILAEYEDDRGVIKQSLQRGNVTLVR